jgi:hypothetical protein
VADAAAQVSLTTLPRDLRWRLRTRDRRAVLWLPAGADLPELTSARLCRERGERQHREEARLAAVLALAAWALVAGALGSRALALRVVAACAAGALLLGAGHDGYLPLLPLAAAAPALGPALALAAGAVFVPGYLWAAAALALAAAGSSWQRSSHS